MIIGLLGFMKRDSLSYSDYASLARCPDILILLCVAFKQDLHEVVQPQENPWHSLLFFLSGSAAASRYLCYFKFENFRIPEINK